MVKTGWSGRGVGIFGQLSTTLVPGASYNSSKKLREDASQLCSIATVSCHPSDLCDIALGKSAPDPRLFHLEGTRFFCFNPLFFKPAVKDHLRCPDCDVNLMGAGWAPTLRRAVGERAT